MRTQLSAFGYLGLWDMDLVIRADNVDCVLLSSSASASLLVEINTAPDSRLASTTRRGLGSGERCKWPVLTVLTAAAIVFTVGVWWGLPAYGSWAPDEISPAQVRDAWEHGFSDGWATKYPPLHYALLAVAFL